MGQFLLGMCAGLSEPLPHYSLFFWPIIDPILVTFGQICNFRHPNLHFHCLFSWIDPFFRLNETTLLSVCSKNILVRLLTVNMTNSLTPKNRKMCDPILVTLLKMRPHSGQSSRKNDTPSSDTSSLASYKAVPPPTPGEKQSCDAPISKQESHIPDRCSYFTGLLFVSARKAIQYSDHP